jgi:bisphosphoglycerate-independent phosphoglycerate mutase (AlkP superfamily)
MTWNTWSPGRGAIAARTVFDAAGEAGLRAGLFTGKKKLRHLAKPGIPPVVEAADRNDPEVMDEALAYIGEEHPALVMIHLPGVDRAGHSSGWLGEEQRRAMKLADGQVGRLLEILESIDAGGSRSVVIVTADHGGSNKGHTPSNASDLTVPWLVWGTDSPPREIHPVCVTDTASVIASVLGLEFHSGME